METTGTSEALRKVLFDCTNVVVGQPLRDPGKPDSVVEKLTRECETTRRVDIELDVLHARGLPLGGS
jgi:hypothetical protein